MPSPSSSPDPVERLFAEYLAVPAAEQDAHFEALCLQHPELAAQLHRLRAERRTPTSPQPAPVTVRMQPGNGPASTLTQTVRSALQDPAETGPLSTTDPANRYTLLGELGRGGMAVALRVFDTVLRRELAMKVLPGDSEATGDEDRQRLAARFVDEARVTGCLEHPGIVPVYDLHADPSGRIFFTMPIIAGVDLREVIERVKQNDPEWTLGRAVSVILKVCEAVAFAHSRGVLHRDLTPANVRIGKFGEVHVIDWGLAKVLGRGERPASEASPADRALRAGESVGLTLHGTVMGTPAYMPPEQAEGRLDDLSPRSDVYAMGALLYHLLAGQAPYSSRRRTLPPDRVLRLVRRGGPPAIERFNRSAPPELVAIAEKAMARRPEDRYADMNAMAADLRAYIDGRVVPTYERGLFAQLRKLVRRNRVASVVVALALFAIAFNIVEFVLNYYTDKHRLEQHNAELRQARDAAVDAAQRAETMRGLAEQHEQQARVGAYVASIVSADTSLRAGDVGSAKLRLQACAKDLRQWEWSHLQLRADGSLQAVPLAARPVALATSGDSARIVVGSEDGRVEAFDLEAAVRTHQLDTGDKPIQSVRLAADGQSAALAFRGGGLAVWDLASGELREIDTLTTLDIASAPDLLACATDGSLVTWRGTVRTALAPALPRPPRLAVLSRDGAEVATLDTDDEVLVRSTNDGATLARIVVGEVVTAIALGRARHLLALGTASGAIRIHSTDDGELLDVLRGETTAVQTLAFDASEQRLVASGDDHVVRVWNLVEREATELRGHERDVVASCFAGGDDLIVSASHDGTLRIWSATGGTELTAYRGFGSPLSCGAFGPDGRQAYFGTSDGFVIGRDTVRTRTTHLWQLDEGVVDLALGADDRIFVLLADGRLVRLLATDLDAPPVQMAGREASVACLCTTAAWLVCGRPSGTVELRAVDGASVLATWQAHDAPLIAVAAEASVLATIAEDRRLRLWRLPSGERFADLELDSLPRTVALRRDGLAVAVDADDSRVLVRELPTGAVTELRGHQRTVVAIAWCGNTRRLASGSEDGTMRLWDLDSGEPLLVERHHGGPVHTVAFGDHCRRLLTISSQFGALILESEPGLQSDLARREGHRAERDWSETLRNLFSQWSTEEQVMAELRSRADVPAAELRLGLILARTRVLRAARLRAEVWQIVASPGAPPNRYDTALAKARAATALVPGDPENPVMEGAALLRCRRPEQALAMLQRVKLEDPAVMLPAVAFLALASAATGDAEGASRHRDRLRESLATVPPGSARHAQYSALLAEVERVAPGK